ncbi:uncharacterized protein [Glycine max]|uniref:uncharacterized protein n=1 Tax=Glycine max TaxID=3847 RepID=UPI0003DE991D|nr:uncharacterized protein LOC102661402 [Glycine max]|eukprot:XP_006599946.1 uncharacterized protein LOC102661402 [Glycine max]
MNDKPFGSALGSLIYAQICTRIDIAFIVGILGRYHLNPRNDRWIVAKKVMRPLKIFWDSNASMFYTKNNKIYRGSKHLDLKYLTVKDLVKDGSIVVDHVNTDSMLADPLTKGLSLLFLDDMLKKWAL